MDPWAWAFTRGPAGVVLRAAPVDSARTVLPLFAVALPVIRPADATAGSPAAP
jgi:hypothetical protein